MDQEYSNPTRAYINLSHLSHNLNRVREKFPESKIILPVKANAYGHGDLIIAREAAAFGVDYLAVARVNEGIRLRKGGINLPILVFGIEWGANIKLGIKYGLEFTLCSPAELEHLESFAAHASDPVAVHLKVDTGITRLGCCRDQVISMAKRLSKSSCFLFKSFYTHFAMSDDDTEFTLSQYQDFLILARELQDRSIGPLFYHSHNSGAILNPALQGNPGLPFAVRPGIMCYGYSPVPEWGRGLLKPVMSLTTKVMHIKTVPAGTGIGYGHTFITEKETHLAAVPLGYGDGIFRQCSNKLQVKIKGKIYPSRGRISMDIIVIEVDERVKPGDEVYVFGPEEGCHNADDLARMAQTISYEITTAISERVERVPRRTVLDK